MKFVTIGKYHMTMSQVTGHRPSVISHGRVSHMMSMGK